MSSYVQVELRSGMVNLWMERQLMNVDPTTVFFHFLVKQCNSYVYCVKVDFYHNILHKKHMSEATPAMMLPVQ